MKTVTIEIETEEMSYDNDLPEVGLWRIVVKLLRGEIVSAYAGNNPWMSFQADNGIYIVEASRRDVDSNLIGELVTDTFTIVGEEASETTIKIKC